MCEMLANKYMAEGNLAAATALFEHLCHAPDAPLSSRYSLLVCHALAGHCADVHRLARHLAASDEELDWAAIRAYRERFPLAVRQAIGRHLACSGPDRHTPFTALNRRVVEELLPPAESAAPPGARPTPRLGEDP